MMKTYDLYGVAGDSMDECRDIVEPALGIRMEPHESGFRGGDYYRLNDVGTEHFILQRNHDDFEDEWAEPDHKDSAFLLYVNETPRAKDIEQRFAKAPTASSSAIRHCSADPGLEGDIQGRHGAALRRRAGQ